MKRKTDLEKRIDALERQGSRLSQRQIFERIQRARHEAQLRDHARRLEDLELRYPRGGD